MSCRYKSPGSVRACTERFVFLTSEPSDGHKKPNLLTVRLQRRHQQLPTLVAHAVGSDGGGGEGGDLRGKRWSEGGGGLLRLHVAEERSSVGGFG